MVSKVTVSVVLTGTDAHRASLQPLLVGWFDYERTDRASVPDQALSPYLLTQRTLDRASLQPLLVGWFDNGRTDRASLQRVTRIIVTRLALTQQAFSH